jgi:type IV pilus assembly protein PilB
MQGVPNKRFIELISAGLPPLVAPEIVQKFGAEHGLGTLAMLQALIAEKHLPKDQACTLWGNSIGIAYVDPISSLISEEAIEKIPHEIASKTRSIPIYVLDGVTTVAMPSPTTPSWPPASATTPKVRKPRLRPPLRDRRCHLSPLLHREGH